MKFSVLVAILAEDLEEQAIEVARAAGEDPQVPIRSAVVEPDPIRSQNTNVINAKKLERQAVKGLLISMFIFPQREGYQHSQNRSQP